MKLDSIRQFVALREGLQKEKLALETRLSQINRALAGEIERGAPVVPAEQKAPARRKPRRRIKNKMSLKAAIIAATKSKPLTKGEILKAVKDLGYRFGSSKPMGSLNTMLYSKRQFKNSGGKFSPA